MTQPSGTDKAREMLERLGRLAARKELDTVAIRRTDLEALLTLPSSPLVGDGLAWRLTNAAQHLRETVPDDYPAYQAVAELLDEAAKALATLSSDLIGEGEE